MAVAKVTTREKLGAISAEQAVNYFNLFIFGDYGAGKTHLAATAQDHPSTSPVLFLDVEGGTATIRKRAEIDVVQVRSINDVVNAWEGLEADQGKTYKTVVVDSLTELQKLDLVEIMKNTQAVQEGKQDEEVPSPREWGKTLNHMRRIVRAYRDLPCNVIFTALALYTKDTSGTVRIIPSLQGKAGGEIPAFLDVVAYLDTGVDEDGSIHRRLITAAHPKYAVKDRLGIGEEIMIDPTISDIWNAIA